MAKESDYCTIKTKEPGRTSFIKLRAFLEQEQGEKLANHEALQKAYEKIKNNVVIE